MNTISDEYHRLLKQLQEMELQQSRLPQGYISKKTIKGKQYFYLQHRTDGKVVSKYIKEDEVASISAALALSKQYKAQIPQVTQRLCALEQAAKLLDRKLSREVMLLKLSYNMDLLSTEQKEKSISFARAMNAIEGVCTSSVTQAKTSDWKNGNTAFLTLFRETLTMYGFPTEVNNA